MDAPTQINGEAKSRDSCNVFYIELDAKSRSSIKTDVIHMTENAKRTIFWLVFPTGFDLPTKTTIYTIRGIGILASSLENFLRRLGLPKAVKDWSLRSLQVKLIKMGAE